MNIPDRSSGLSIVPDRTSDSRIARNFGVPCVMWQIQNSTILSPARNRKESNMTAIASAIKDTLSILSGSEMKIQLVIQYINSCTNCAKQGVPHGYC